MGCNTFLLSRGTNVTAFFAFLVSKQKPLKWFGHALFPESDAHADAESGNERAFAHAADVVQLGHRQQHGQNDNEAVKDNFAAGHGLSGDLRQRKRYAVCGHGHNIRGDVQKNTGAKKYHAAQHIEKLNGIGWMLWQQGG